MAVTDPTRSVTANGNDVATVFPFNPMEIYDSTQLSVYKTDVAGVITLLAEGVSATTYSVSVASYPGTGSITYPASGGTPLATGEVLTIIRELPIEQTLVLNNQGGYFPEDVEDALDKLTMIALQLQEQLDRAVQVPAGDATDPADLIAQLEAAAQLAQDAADAISGLNVVPATETQAGYAELATQSEANTGTDDARIMTPLKARLSEKIAIVITVMGESTAVTTGTAKVTFRMPFAMTLTAVRGSLKTAQTSGSILTVDVNDSGTTILSTKLTIDNAEKTSTTAATAAVLSDTALADDAEITIDVDQIGDGTAIGLKVTLIGYRA